MEIISRKAAEDSSLKRYFTGKPCKHGHIDERLVKTQTCLSCAKIYRARDYDKHRASRLASAAGFRANNSETIRKKDAVRNVLRRDAKADQHIRYNEANKAERSAKHVELRRRKRATDPVFAAKHRIRSLIAQSLKKCGFGKSTKTAAILGCTFGEFKVHIERQFLRGMTWENRNLWQIDHITPMASARTEADAIALNRFTNLRPMWSADNLEKSDKILFLI